MPSPDPGMVIEFMARTTIMTSRAIIISLLILSMPLFNPKKQTANPMTHIMTVQRIIVGASASIPEKASEIIWGSAPSKSPLTLRRQ